MICGAAAARWRLRGGGCCVISSHISYFLCKSARLLKSLMQAFTHRYPRCAMMDRTDTVSVNFAVIRHHNLSTQAFEALLEISLVCF